MLPVPEAARDRHRDERTRGQRHGDVGAHPEVRERQADADELGYQREKVEDDEVAASKGALEAAEALHDEPRVTDPGDGAE